MPLNPNFFRQLAPYRDTGALIDTSLLLLLFVGSHSRDLIPNFKRTRRYSIEDYEIISQLVYFFNIIATTPNILTEVSNFCGQFPDKMHAQVFETFRRQMLVLNETYVPSREASEADYFQSLRLTDSVIGVLAERGLLVITDDFPLSNRLAARNLPVINFNHLRPVP